MYSNIVKLYTNLEKRL